LYFNVKFDEDFFLQNLKKIFTYEFLEVIMKLIIEDWERFESKGTNYRKEVLSTSLSTIP